MRMGGAVRSDEVTADAFEAFVLDAEPRLWRAMAAGFGPAMAREAVVDALAWGWEHWERLHHMANPVGYLFRVAQNQAKRAARRSRRPVITASTAGHEATFEPALEDALEHLSARQRTVVGLVHGFGWSLSEVAEVLGITKSSVQKHEERGMALLRRHLGVMA